MLKTYRPHHRPSSRYHVGHLLNLLPIAQLVDHRLTHRDPANTALHDGDSLLDRRLTTRIANRIVFIMTKTISLRLDQRLLRAIEVASKTTHKNRSAVVSEALELWLKRRAVAEKVRRHREGYVRHPVTRNEFAPVLKAQTWPK